MPSSRPATNSTNETSRGPAAGSPRLLYAVLGALLLTVVLSAAEPAPGAANAGAAALAVPYVSQLDGSAFAGTNCGPAALAMVLAYTTGDRYDPVRLRQALVRQGAGYAADPQQGTNLADLVRLARAEGAGVVLGDGPDSVGWTLERLRSQLDAGHPVIVLARLGSLPGYPPGDPTDHYLVLVGVTADGGFLYHDPALPQRRQAPRVIAGPQLARAQRAAAIPLQGAAFEGALTAAAVRPEEEPEEPATFEVVVAPGDTVWGLARRYGVEMQQIAALNRDTLRRLDYIVVGQKLRLPAPDPPAQEPAAEPEPALQAARERSPL